MYIHLTYEHLFCKYFVHQSVGIFATYRCCHPCYLLSWVLKWWFQLKLGIISLLTINSLNTCNIWNLSFFMNRFLLRPLMSLSHGISFPIENVVIHGFLNVYKMNDNKLQTIFLLERKWWYNVIYHHLITRMQPIKHGLIYGVPYDLFIYFSIIHINIFLVEKVLYSLSTYDFHVSLKIVKIHLVKQEIILKCPPTTFL